ncbi:Phosphoenolpyruvate guanylyltransferase [Methanimicrococcus hongohii]|uniref:2-phospho-L-lactate guanylyltransferase n=1 Tax=Methanimicrococcus hongohii TaxID=3028295 RepID=A0AA96V971_9EURY|nr:hypothetical protein [Methanimicrococcus sp. Hf6]WNY22802.1 Phosphoenolpyruvate guanylyltransferase [Methanimicrococcus sp. Hf6]
MRAIKTVIPFKPDNPKSRLASVLTEEERKIFVGLSLENVLSVLKEAGIKQVEILSKSVLNTADENNLMSFSSPDFEIIIITDEADLSTAVNTYLKSSDVPVFIVMADLALLTKEDVKAMTEPMAESMTELMAESMTELMAESMTELMAESMTESLGESMAGAMAMPVRTNFIRIAPGKDGGTNMMYIGAPDVFEVNYYGESFKKHKEEAERKNLICEVRESFYAAADMDEPEDLFDILRYGSGKILAFVEQTIGEKEGIRKEFNDNE